jgi:4-amino-4-deoxy-L-arabinose transferase-like glycosyltransferase
MKAESSDSQEETAAFPGEDRRSKSARLVCWSVCIGLALLDAWSSRQYTNEDGISYLDMSDALLKHNWHLLINPHWSPLYPFLIGVARWIARPSAYWELSIVHVVNFAIFMGALGSFDFLLRQVICDLGRDDGRRDSDSLVLLPAWRWQLLGYSFFALSTFVLINGLRITSPDLLVAAFLYLDAGLVLKLRKSTKRSRTCLLLGLTLGLGYLAKAILFPMALVFLAVAFFVIGKWQKAVLSLSMTVLIFSAIAAPLFIEISRTVGRPSFGEAGNLNLAWEIEGQEHLPFYTSAPPTYLKHPLILLHRHPDVFGFGGSDATYPLWRDPQYWMAGASTAFDLRSRLRFIVLNFDYLMTDPFILPIWCLAGGVLILLFLSPDLPRRSRHIVRSWPLFVPGAAGLAMYVLVLVQPRYIAPFVVLVSLGLFPGIFLSKPNDPGKRNATAIVSFAAFSMVFTALFVAYHLAGSPFPQMVSQLTGSHPRKAGSTYVQAAKWLNRDSVQPGDTVALIGEGSGGMILARLAGLRIVAQIPPEVEDDFWQISDPRQKTEVYEALAKAGAKAVITEETPPPGSSADWQRVGDTQYYVHILTLRQAPAWSGRD